MSTLGEVAAKVRSKNAGPFWVTVDIFCDNDLSYRAVCEGLSTRAVARALGVPEQGIKRFQIDDLQVVKLSLPRPAIQGTPADRDMHGAALGALLAEMTLEG